MNDDLGKQIDDPNNYHRKPKGRRKLDAIDFLITVVLLAVVLLLFIGVLAIAFPDAAKTTAANLLAPSGGAGRILVEVGDQARNGIDYRIRPMLAKARELFVFRLGKRRSTRSEPRRQPVKVDKCLSCHPDLFEVRATGHLYVNHRQHEAAGVECGICHLNDRHPRPGLIKERVCVACHKTQSVATACKTCHKPGSILDDRVIDQAKIADFLGSRTANRNILVPKGFEHPVDYEKQTCKQCHGVPEFCAGCHINIRSGKLSSPHDNQWTPTHGIRILKGELAVPGCWKCHNSMFCAGACHPNPNQQRISPKWPLPKVKLP